MQSQRTAATEPQSAVSEDDIRRQVESFYAEVRRDPELAPLFEAAIGPDWGPHLDLMCDFWSGVMRMSGRYKGKPLQAHRALPGLTPVHFRRWLGLFHATAARTQRPAAAALFVQRAERIAATLQQGVFGRGPAAAAEKEAKRCNG